jgi:hypothetical protein
MISAATAATAVLMVTPVRDHGLEYLLAATVLAGLIQIGAGLLRLIGMNEASETIVDRLAIHDKPGATDKLVEHWGEAANDRAGSRVGGRPDLFRERPPSCRLGRAAARGAHGGHARTTK